RFARNAQRKHCAAKWRYSLGERNAERMIFLARPFSQRVFENEDIAPGARASKSVINLKVDGEYPEIHSGKTLMDLNVVRRYSLRASKGGSTCRLSAGLYSA